VLIITCEKNDCVNKSKDGCAADSIRINADGECISYCSFEDLMKERPKENWRK
jgi:hypothetical protein